LVHPGNHYNSGRLWVGRISQPSRHYESDKLYTEYGEFSDQRVGVSPQHVYYSQVFKQPTAEPRGKELKENGSAIIKNYISKWFNWDRVRKQH